MNLEITKKEAVDLIKLLCDEQVRLIQSNPKQRFYESEKYKRLEELKVKFKTVR